jgi:hypothetical protein
MLAISRRTTLGMILAAPTLGVAATMRDGLSLAEAARDQIGVTKAYDANYRAISYPGGDVLRTTGVCADVLVARRARRLGHRPAAARSRGHAARLRRLSLPRQLGKFRRRRTPISITGGC